MSGRRPGGGLSKVYVQAKRYSPGNSVQRPEVQAFAGALIGKAGGGVFITTSRFSQGALDWVEKVSARIILIDGQRLAELMIEFGVAASDARRFVSSRTREQHLLSVKIRIRPSL